MPRKPRNPLFKKTDFDRLVEAARAKNLPIHRIDVMRDGLSLVVGEPVNNGSGDVNPWDEVLNAANEKRPA